MEQKQNCTVHIGYNICRKTLHFQDIIAKTIKDQFTGAFCRCAIAENEYVNIYFFRYYLTP